MSKIAHKLVAKTAFEIACEVYEVLAGANDRFHQAYPTMESFVSRCWPEFIGDARRALVQMLQPIPSSDPAHPEFRYSEHMRNEIAEALILEGEVKAAPPLDLNELRAAAGIEPLPRPLPTLH
jgi:hypothetical protein